MKIRAFPALMAAGLLAGCAAPAATTTSSPAASSPSAQPVTAAAVQAAATTYFDLYAAGQYDAVYGLLSPAARSAIDEATWTAVHQECVKPGLAYSATRPTLAGTTGVVNVSLAGAGAALGSEEESFTYSAGRWWYSPSNVAVYQGHTAAQAVAALKASGQCS